MKTAKYSVTAPEEQVKACVAKDFFSAYDTTNFIGKIDFSVAETEGDPALMRSYLLWAEAKKGAHHDIDESFVQLILTIGKAKTHESYLPPRYLGAFDAARIAFLPYSKIMDIFSMNDFNWNVQASDHTSREFLLLRKRVADTLAGEKLVFDYLADETELRRFIRQNFARHAQPGVTQIRITKNNFPHIYNKWRAAVKPSINFTAWDDAKKSGIIDADFFLADLLSESDKTLTDRLNILLKSDRYRQAAGKNYLGQTLFTEIGFNDGQKAHSAFWRLYRRPPEQEYWDYIVNRRDLLVPQDIREVKGAFFTPSRWVELSQEYLARELGEDWQDEYVVWDCCAGTGNLLAGLTNKKNLWASTLDQADVDVMLQRIEHMNEGLAAGDSGANLYPSHVFQFDFLNDSFDNLPEGLRAIVNDPQKRKKLVIYINPPYAEAANAKQTHGTGTNKTGVSNQTQVWNRFQGQMGKAIRELYIQFLLRIHEDVSGCVIGHFSTLKSLQGAAFGGFRLRFQAHLASLFLMPAFTFDNVKGKFPIGFFIWRTARKELFEAIHADVYGVDGSLIGAKTIAVDADDAVINKWLKEFSVKHGTEVAGMCCVGNDFQHQNYVNIATSTKHIKGVGTAKGVAKFKVIKDNVIVSCVYFAVRQCIKATWLNDRDQFLEPNNSWKDDKKFQWDCLVYAIFHGQNHISSSDGPNHWVPFSEEEIGTRDEIKSHFMIDLLAGKAEKRYVQGDLLKESENTPRKPVFSPEARAVLEAGKALYRYYHAQPDSNPDASFYDIRLHFQGTDEKGRMNAKSGDETYNARLEALRAAMKELAGRIADGVYRHGFLK